MNNELYESLIYDIAKIVKSELNEMSKNISFRNIDRKLWLTVASTISKNKTTEAEFIKPMNKLTLDDLLQRYVAALLITKKPCPKTKKDIETLKTYKLYGLKALELGAKISDIKELYNQNSNQLKKQINKSVDVKPQKTLKTPITPDKTTTQPVQRKKRIDKYVDILESLIVNLPEKTWNNITTIRTTYNLENNTLYKKCLPQLESYIKGIIRKSHNSIDKFGELIRKDFKQFYKIMNIDSNIYISIKEYFGSTHSRWDSYSNYLNILITADKTEMFHTYNNHSFSDKREFRYSYNDDQIFKNIIKYSPKIYVDNDTKKTINLLQEFCFELFFNVVLEYIKYKQENRYSNNKSNLVNILKKYNIKENISDKRSWVKNNIQKVLYNNPDFIIPINYGDWSGSVKCIYYDSKYNKYYVDVYCQTTKTDTDDTDYLSSLLNCRDSYSYKTNDTDYYGNRYSCYVSDVDEVFNIIYNNVLELIKEGKLN